MAKIYVSVLGSKEEKAKTMEGFKSAKGLIRSEVSKALGIRHSPEIHFVLDEGIEHSMRVSVTIRGKGLKTNPREQVFMTKEPTGMLGEIPNRSVLKQIADSIKKSSRVLLLEHKKPDGDCIGSGLALALALSYVGKEALLLSQDPHPTTYDFLPGRRLYTTTSRMGPGVFEPDLVVFLDCTDRKSGRRYQAAKVKRG